jgi:hypothetical protein
MHPALVPFPAEEDAEGGVLDEERDYSPVLTLEEFIELLMPTLVNLSRDSIVNIRICAARCLKAVRDEEEYLRNFDNQGKLTIILSYLYANYRNENARKHLQAISDG